MDENQYEYAGFWIRVWAAIIDTFFILLVIAIPLTVIYGTEYWDGEQTVYGFWDITLNYVMPFFLTMFFWLKFLGTPGKMANRLKIVDVETGHKITPLQAVGRYLAYIPASLPLLLGIFWVGFDKKKQGWHDKLAGTVVIKSKRQEPVKFE